MTQDQVLSLVRAALLIAGIFLVTTETHQGAVSATDWQTIVGAILTVVPIIWSMVAHAPSQSTRALAGSTK